VCGLNISMNDSAVVKVLDGPCGLHDEVKGLEIAQSTSLFHVVVELDTVHELRGYKANVTSPSEAIKPGEIFVLDVPAMAHFGMEEMHYLLVLLRVVDGK